MSIETLGSKLHWATGFLPVVTEGWDRKYRQLGGSVPNTSWHFQLEIGIVTPFSLILFIIQQRKSLHNIKCARSKSRSEYTKTKEHQLTYSCALSVYVRDRWPLRRWRVWKPPLLTSVVMAELRRINSFSQGFEQHADLAASDKKVGKRI